MKDLVDSFKYGNTVENETSFVDACRDRFEPGKTVYSNPEFLKKTIDAALKLIFCT